MTSAAVAPSITPIEQRQTMPRAALVLALALIAGLTALHIRHYVFLCDDAYIMFRYARNLAHGHGLVFNVGERVEGYTSFLWVLQLSIGYLLGAPGDVVPHVLSVAYTAAAMGIWVWFILQQPAAHRWAVALLVLFGLAVNRSWAVWATSGLETRAFTCCVLLTFALLARAEQLDSSRRWRGLVGVSLALSAAALTRPDGQIFLPVLILFSLASRRGRAESAALALPCLIIIGGHYLWRREYYGVWLPNTYYAKVVAPWPAMGARYFAAFVIEYAYYLVLPFIALVWCWVPSALSRRLGYTLAACMALHAGYYCYAVGGDHFEFRIFDFYAPLILWMAAEALVTVATRRPCVATAAGLIMLVYSVVIPTSALFNTAHLQPRDVLPAIMHTGEQFTVTTGNTPGARWLPFLSYLIDLDRRLMAKLNGHFIATRQEIHKICWLGFKENIELAVGVAERGVLPPLTAVSFCPGILGYYVDVPIVDAHGLTDATVAHAPVPDSVIGDWRFMAHERTASFEYLEQRHAHVQVISATHAPLPQGKPYPWFTPPGRTNRQYSIRIGNSVWLNIATWDSEWVARNFHVTPSDLVALPAGGAR